MILNVDNNLPVNIHVAKLPISYAVTTLIMISDNKYYVLLYFNNIYSNMVITLNDVNFF